MLKQKSVEASCDNGLSALALAGHLGASALCSSVASRAEVARDVAALSGDESSVTELDPIEISDDECFDEISEMPEGLHGAPMFPDNHCVLVEDAVAVETVLPEDLSHSRVVGPVSTAVVKAWPPQVVSKSGIADGRVLGTSALAEGIAASIENGSSPAAGHIPLQTNGSSAGLALSVGAELVSLVQASEAAGAGTAKRPRARWGRCSFLSCQAPLRLLVDHKEGRPFLGCSRWKSSNPTSCKFRMAFPSERRAELPLRMRSARRMDW
jgi:hypothetical protein